MEEPLDLLDRGIEVIENPSGQVVEHIVIMDVIFLANDDHGLAEGICPEDLANGADGNCLGAQEAGEHQVRALEVEAVSCDRALAVEEACGGQGSRLGFVALAGGVRRVARGIDDAGVVFQRVDHFAPPSDGFGSGNASDRTTEIDRMETRAHVTAWSPAVLGCGAFCRPVA